MSSRLATLQQQSAPSKRDEAYTIVFGACFLDYVGYVDRMPKPGETLHSHSFAKGFGGKGANQAVMTARLGGNVRMVSVVGSDGDGDAYIENMKANNVDTRFLRKIPGDSSGLAMIFVDRNTAQNEIVICPNATLKMDAAFVRSQLTLSFLDHCKVLVCQNEVPLDATLLVLEEAFKRGVYTIFNAAPAPSKDEAERIKPYLQYVSLFCPNETEASLITGIDVTGVDEAFRAVAALRAMGVRDVVITLGSRGYVLSEHGAEPTHHTAERVKAVDTTGAGDCFVGAMSYFLQTGDSLASACKKANVCAAISVQAKGTQTSFPYRKQLPPSLFAASK